MKFQEKYLYDRLSSLSQSSIYPYHMPGHKRHMKGYPLEQLYGIDITEIDDFDNLHEPKGIISVMQERIQSIYHTQETFCLINGSSCGILSAISATTSRKGSVMLARNSHKSAYHAIFLEELTAVYLQPEYIDAYGLYGSVRPQMVEQAFREHPECKIVLITSPTYEGIVADIQAIADIVHEHQGILIVDEAHGAHLKFTGQEEKSAVIQGADIVIQSIHKTLPAPTQTALLHICSSRVDRKAIRRYLSIYQSSSPSYVLLAGIEQCFSILGKEADERRAFFLRNIEWLKERIGQCRHIHILPGTELGKLVLCVYHSSWTGRMLYEILILEYGLQMEMAAKSYVVAIMTLMDTQEGYERLADALLEIDAKIQLSEGEAVSNCRSLDLKKLPEAALTIYGALSKPRDLIPLRESAGRIAAEFIYLYPPGIPVIAPGERYTADIIQTILQSSRMGLIVQGMDKEQKVYALLA